MGWPFGRRSRLPAARRPPLERDERVVAWAVVHTAAAPASDPGSAPGEAVESGTVVVTNRGMWLPDERGRLGWHHIHKAVWSGRVLTITPAEVVAERAGYAVVADRPVRSYLLLEPGDVPYQVRSRVTNSVAYSQHHPMPGGGGARLAARRVSGVDGLTWTVRLDPGTDGDGPAVLAALDQLVTHARHSTTPEP